MPSNDNAFVYDRRSFRVDDSAACAAAVEAAASAAATTRGSYINSEELVGMEYRVCVM